MSLDLTKKQVFNQTGGTAITGTWVAAGDVTPAIAVEDGRNQNIVTVEVDATAGDIVLTPVAVPGIEAGDIVRFVKIDNSANKISFTDGATSIVYDFINQPGEMGCVQMISNTAGILI